MDLKTVTYDEVLCIVQHVLNWATSSQAHTVGSFVH